MQDTTSSATHRDTDNAVHIESISFEHRHAALGIGVAHPRLSWAVQTALPNWQQAACEIRAVGCDGSTRDESIKLENAQSVLVAWHFAPLTSRERVQVSVRVWGMDGSASPWSVPHMVEAGLLSPADWSARFVGPSWVEDTSRPQPVPLLRREFDVRNGLVRARLYVTALGVYEAHINGACVGDQVLAPGWTRYSHQLHYQTFDVTHLLHTGANAMGAMVADGWYRGWLGFNGGKRNIYGDQLGLLAQLELTYADGTVERVVTDNHWHATTGPILLSGLYEGETYDARLERTGWSAPGHDARDWSSVALIEHDLKTLLASPAPPVRRIELVQPVNISKSPSGKTLVDFGQNLVGRLRIRVRGETGRTITLRHAEVLENGELGTRPLRRVQATERYTCRDNGDDVWEPRFTFHGFRYAEVDGWLGELQPDDLQAVVIHSDMVRTGWFECSDMLINKLHDNIVWSMRGNFLSIPTDCPQRDERLGWTGDIQVFAPTAAFLYDVSGFLQSWLRDLASEQHDLGGLVPMVVPDILDWPPRAIAAWGDAAVIVPWVLYQRYGDRDILREQFASMCAWVNHVAGLSKDGVLWNEGLQLGDWLDPAAPPDAPAKAMTDRHLVASAYFAQSAALTAQAAGVLGERELAEHYSALAKNARAAFAAEYITPSGRLVSDSQTALALALEFGLIVDPVQRAHAGARLAKLVRDNGYRIGTGFVGTPIICDALTGAGELATAYELLEQRDCPSWLYPVTMGATTTWERWDSMLPDGSINSGEMTSFNHYALGAVADWLQRVVAGLSAAEPGYRRIAIAPRPGGGLTQARARHLSAYGMIECGWEMRDGHMTVEATIPPNTTAQVTLPGTDRLLFAVGSGSHRWHYVLDSLMSRTPLSIDSTLGEFRAVPQVWAWLSKTLPSLLQDFIFSMTVLQSSAAMTMRDALATSQHKDKAMDAISLAIEAMKRR